MHACRGSGSGMTHPFRPKPETMEEDDTTVRSGNRSNDRGSEAVLICNVLSELIIQMFKTGVMNF